MTRAGMPSSRDQQKGGVAILVALIILVTMTVAAFSVSRNTLREIAITGNDSVGRKALEAADAGVDYAITWGNPDANKIISVTDDPLHPGGKITAVVDAGLSGTRLALQNQLTKLLLATGSSDPGTRVAADDPGPDTAVSATPESVYGTVSNQTGSLRVFLRSVDYPSTELFLSGPGQPDFKQATSLVTQSFDTEIRYLGVSFNDRFKPVGVKKNGGLFLVRTIGRATVGDTGQVFISRREVLMDYNP